MKQEYLIRLFFSFFITILIVNKAFKKKSLSKSGCIAAFFVGIIVSLANICHFSSLLAFFYASNKATKFRQDEKRKIEEDFKEKAILQDGQRDAFQVLCNGLIPTIFSALYLFECGIGERRIDFANEYKASFYTLAILSSFACCCGDTFSSELGTVLNKGNKVFHVIKLKLVPKGTNGGVSIYGTLASFIGGFCVGFAYFFTLLLTSYFDRNSNLIVQWSIILIGTLSGFFGSLLDSLIGGLLQFSGLNPKTKKITQEASSLNVQHISGISLLTNNQVNFVSSFFIAILTPYVVSQF